MTETVRQILIKTKEQNVYSITIEEGCILLHEYLKEKTGRDVPINPVITDQYRLQIYNMMLERAFNYYLPKLENERQETERDRPPIV